MQLTELVPHIAPLRVRAGGQRHRRHQSDQDDPVVTRHRVVRLLALAMAAASCQPAGPTPSPGPAAATVPRIIPDSIPGTLVSWELVMVPGDPATGMRAFLIGRTELLWDAYDAYMMSPPDSAGRKGADAVSRPSRPYGAPDYGWGHRGFATISVTREAAEAFCVWLSARTGHRYRLPTEAEWRHVARLAAGPTPSAARIDSLAWHAGNSGNRARPAASRAPDALGLYDLFGNAAEWVLTADGRRVILGGSFRDPLAAVGPHASAQQDETWTERDPQIPKSRWWMSDGPFAGFRILRELP